jgi:HD-GYP domain-containing protein (c-di-GMP phosphodiesterase class II)
MEIDSYESPDAEALLAASGERLARRTHQRRELITHGVGASGFLIAGGLLAALAPWSRSLSVPTLALVLTVWVLVERVRFPVSSGWTRPTMLAFVPALFVLPTPVVPLVASVAILFRRAPDFVRGRVTRATVLAFICDAWFTVGPALVIVLGSAQDFAWTHWPVYIAAVLAQLAFDVAAWVSSSWFAERVPPTVELPLLTWTYAVDAMLWPLGLLIAAAAVNRPGLILLALSPTAMLVFFARERQQRLDQVLDLSTAYRGTALLLGEVIEADDRYTGIHSRDVVDLCVAVADALGLSAIRRRDLEFAALLHDVGKIQIPKEIIHKPGALNDEEWTLMRQHTIIGERMLKQVGGRLAQVGRLVRASHERIDGRGYPDGLAGEEIPLESRIVSVCDAFNAMTTERPYRPTKSTADALIELRRCAGTHFDPTVVRALERKLGPVPAPPMQPSRAPAALADASRGAPSRPVSAAAPRREAQPSR